MIRRNSLRSSIGRSGLSCTISLKERIEVSGVLSSWLTVVTKSSLSLSSSFSRSLAALQFVGRRFEFLALCLQPPAVDDELGGFVQDLHDLVDVVHLLAQHRGHHDARRGRADGAGKLSLDIRNDVGVGRTGVVEAAIALACEAVEGGFGQRLAEEAGRADAANLRPSRDRARSARRVSRGRRCRRTGWPGCAR